MSLLDDFDPLSSSKPKRSSFPLPAKLPPTTPEKGGFKTPTSPHSPLSPAPLPPPVPSGSSSTPALYRNIENVIPHTPLSASLPASNNNFNITINTSHANSGDTTPRRQSAPPSSSPFRSLSPQPTSSPTMVPVTGIGPNGLPTTILVPAAALVAAAAAVPSHIPFDEPHSPLSPNVPRSPHNRSTSAMPPASSSALLNPQPISGSLKTPTSTRHQSLIQIVPPSPVSSNGSKSPTNASLSAFDFDAIATRQSPSTRSLSVDAKPANLDLSATTAAAETKSPINDGSNAPKKHQEKKSREIKNRNSIAVAAIREVEVESDTEGGDDDAGDEGKSDKKKLKKSGRRGSVDRRSKSLMINNSSSASNSLVPSPKATPKEERTRSRTSSRTNANTEAPISKETIQILMNERDKQAELFHFSRSKSHTTLGFIKHCLLWKFVVRPGYKEPSQYDAVEPGTLSTPPPEESHEIELFHSVVSGKRTIKIDGNIIIQEKKLIDSGSKYALDVGSRLDHKTRCELIIEATGSEFVYQLIIDGLPFEESRSRYMRELNKRYEKLASDAQKVGIRIEPLPDYSNDTISNTKSDSNSST